MLTIADTQALTLAPWGEGNNILFSEISAGDSKGHLNLETTCLVQLTLFHEVVKGKYLG